MNKIEPIDWQIQSGPCVSCGEVNYPLSFGGPMICPACDTYGKPRPTEIALRKEVQRLREALSEKEVKE